MEKTIDVPREKLISPLFFAQTKFNKVLLKSPKHLQHFMYLAFFCKIWWNGFCEIWFQIFITSAIFNRLESFYSHVVSNKMDIRAERQRCSLNR